MVSRVYTVGVIGHCDVGGFEAYSYAQLCCHEILTSLKSKYSSIKAVSAISKGADSIFAQSVITLGIQLESIIPFGKFMSDFSDEEDHERCKYIRNKTISETEVNFSERSGAAYRKSMEWVVFKSSMIVAVWDGKEAGSPGGTWEAVSLCKKLRKKFIHIDVSTMSINIYFNNYRGYSKVINEKAKNIIRYL